MRAVARALLAVRYLTIVPLLRGPHANLEELGRAAAWFPVIGAALGVVLAGVDVLGTRGFPSALAALLTLSVWKVLTGGLHLDGLADCLDGLAGRDPAQRRAIMRDSRIGAFGVIGLILFLMLELNAVSELAHGVRWRALVAAPAIARAAPGLVGALFPAAHADGQGAAFSAGLRPAAVVVGLGVAIAVAAAALGGLGIVALVFGIGGAVAVGAFFARRLGGVTGDVLGAGVETAELVFLLTIVAWTHARG
jgi:adenosylcobinamide-GDP ribazoletransferase